MYVLRKELKILKKVSRRPADYNKLCRRYTAKSVSGLIHAGYLKLDRYESDASSNERGFYDSSEASRNVPAGTLVRITESGIAEVDQRAWFTLEFVARNILVPIAIGVGTSVILSLMRVV